MPREAQTEFLRRLTDEAASRDLLPGQWRRDGGWLLAPAGVASVSFGFSVRRHDAGVYVHIARSASTAAVIASLEEHRASIERDFGGALAWGAPRGRERFHVYATFAEAGYADPPSRWGAATAHLVEAMARLMAAV